MKKKIEISSWPRRSHYEYFQTFDCPMFSITSPVRVDALYRYAKREGFSFFILCLFVLLNTAISALWHGFAWAGASLAACTRGTACFRKSDNSIRYSTKI